MAEIFSAEPGKLDLVLVSGDDFLMNFQIVSDLTGWTLTANLLTDPAMVFTFNWVQQDQGKFTISLTKEQTAALSSSSFLCWNLQCIDSESLQRTLIVGTLKVLSPC